MLNTQDNLQGNLLFIKTDLLDYISRTLSTDLQDIECRFHQVYSEHNIWVAMDQLEDSKQIIRLDCIDVEGFFYNMYQIAMQVVS